MTRQPLIAGNWKMHLRRAQAVELAAGIAQAAARDSLAVELAVCPPFVYLEVVGAALKGSPVALGAQNMHDAPEGPYTGEISGPMLRDLGCRYVILGHSERRHGLGESDQWIGKKVQAALRDGLIPILCVGETLMQREAGQTLPVVRQQMEAALAGVPAESAARMIVAYEPVWAIGTGKVAHPEQAEEVHADLRSWLSGRYNAAVAQGVRILYGGSVKPDNAPDLLRQPNVDGALVGGASLQVESFLGIARAA